MKQLNEEQIKNMLGLVDPTPDQLQKTISSLQLQLSDYIGKYTDIHVKYMESKQKNKELEQELEEYREKEIEEMDEGAE